MIQPTSDFSVRISNNHQHDDSDSKITPKTLTASSYDKKATRTNQNSNHLIQIKTDNYFSTGEKSTNTKPKREDESQDLP